MISKIKKFINYPIYKKIDSVKDHFYQIKSLIFVRNNRIHVDDGSPEDSIINNYNKINTNHIFQNSSFYYCKRMIDFIIDRNYNYPVFIDLGSGKGKICFEVADKYKYQRIIGVEYDRNLHTVAENNSRKIKSNKVWFENIDVIDYKVPDEKCVIYLFNSFGEDVLRKFIMLNIKFLKKNKSILLYRHDMYASVLEEFDTKLIDKDYNRNDSIWIFE
jgi:hypothetical protein